MPRSVAGAKSRSERCCRAPCAQRSSGLPKMVNFSRAHPGLFWRALKLESFANGSQPKAFHRNI